MGEIDLPSRNTTRTLSRDTDENLEFTPPIFYDAQEIMVNKNSKIKDVKVGQPFGLARGQNALWKDGSLMYSPPFN